MKNMDKLGKQLNALKKSKEKWVLIQSLFQSVLIVLWMYLEKFLGLHDENIEYHGSFMLLFLIPLFFLYRFCFRELKNRKVRLSSIKNYLLVGLKIGLVMVLFTPALQYFFHNYISPNFLIINMGHFVKNEGYSVNEALSFFTLNNYIVLSAIATLIANLVMSLIFYFTRNSKFSK